MATPNIISEAANALALVEAHKALALTTREDTNRRLALMTADTVTTQAVLTRLIQAQDNFSNFQGLTNGN